ncbi:MAG: hypothetical protein V1725_00650 [archaeon]
MDQIKLLESMFDRKAIVILRLFLNNPDKQYYVREVAKATKQPIATTFRALQKYLGMGIIAQTKIKHLKIYQLQKNDNTSFLQQLFEEKKSILQSFIDQVSTIEGVSELLLHGKEEKEKANIVIIGKSIDDMRVREIVVAIKNEYNFTISHLILSQEQFAQMEAMGLFPGKKTALFERKQ